MHTVVLVAMHQSILLQYDKSHNELGASYIEIDLQRTKDGHLVAMHDEKVDRTTNGSGRVEDYTQAELKQSNEQNPQLAKDSYKGATVPTLDEILTRYGTDANYYIETKHLMFILAWNNNC